MDGNNAQASLSEFSARFDKAFASSALVAGLRLLAGTESRLRSGRPLSKAERSLLEGQGNVCADWSRVRLESGAGSDAGLEAVHHNRFDGDVFLGGFKGSWPGPDSRPWLAGLNQCRVRNAVIGNACLHRISRLEDQVIGDGAVLADIGELSCPSPTLFGLGQAIHPGTETGARSVWIWDSLTLDDAMAALALPGDSQRAFRRKLDAALSPLRARFGYVGPGASIVHARRVVGAYLGPGAAVSGASLLRESALMSSADEPCAVADDGWIESSLLQPGARVESGGKVSGSLLLEYASVAWGGMVIQSIVGPHTQVQKGEMTASLVGPFVGFHHQSLLISALWPEGRGNIAYGANVGSNHTGKKPDQEIRPGEGTFFGLGCSIKFPANFEDAPYSLVASGVSTLPQRLAFPFSLLNQPVSAVPGPSPALNEIVPGWMWSDNAYSLARRSYKFENSNRARRHDFAPDPSSTWKTGFFSGRLFTAALAGKALMARQCLGAAPSGSAYYLEDQIPGLGKNFLRGTGREYALAAYADYLAFFLMRTYTDGPRESWPSDLPALCDAISRELGAGGEIKTYLAAQRPRLAAFRQSILASLLREDKRGRQIFDDYADFHSPPEQDDTVVRLDKDLLELDLRLTGYLDSPG